MDSREMKLSRLQIAGVEVISDTLAGGGAWSCLRATSTRSDLVRA